MPPIMLWIGIITVFYNHPSFFILIYLGIFIYFLILTSRKLSPILIIIAMSLLLYFLFQSDDLLVIHQIV
ncbi:M50 family peptidase, partial [Staphylococcus hominis]